MGWDKRCNWCFPFNSKLWKFLLEIKWNRLFYVRSDQNICDHKILKVVHFDQSGHFSALFHLTKLLSLLLLLLQNMQWLGSDKFS